MLNKSSPIPLYMQLAHVLRQRILDGYYKDTQKIPSEPHLAAHHGIGRPTVRQATDTLIREGLLERRQGMGTYITAPKPSLDLLALSGVSQALAASELKTKSQWLQTPQRVENEAALTEHKLSSSSVYRCQRLTYINAAPALLETFYLEANSFIGFEKVFEPDVSLSEQVRTHYLLKATQTEQRFSTLMPNRSLAQLMDVNVKTPLLHVQRQLYFASENPLIYCDLLCLTERFDFTQTLFAHSG